MTELLDENVIGETLTPKQERFCVNYTQNYVFFGKATSSYADAYDIDLDNASKDDEIYRLTTGEEVDTKAFNDLPKEKTKGAELIKESTYTKLYNYCSKAGSRLRRNGKVQARCRELLNEFMNESVIDARLTEIILKGEDKDSVAAIKEFNALRQRITKKHDVTSNGESIGGFNFIRADEQKG